MCSKAAFDNAVAKEAKKKKSAEPVAGPGRTRSAGPGAIAATDGGSGDAATYGDTPLTPGKDGSSGGLVPNPVSTEELLALCEAAGPRRVFIRREDDDTSLGIRMCVFIIIVVIIFNYYYYIFRTKLSKK